MKKLKLLLLSLLLLTSCSPKEDSNIVNVTIHLSDERNIRLELYKDVAPISVENFISLVDQNYYDGLIFHRVIKDFMIQTGGYYLEGYNVLRKDSPASIKGEFASNGVENNLKHTPGVISMARGNDKDSANAQFFICSAECEWLDGEYAAFGKTRDEESLQVVMDISNTPTIAISYVLTDFPATPVVISSITKD